MTQLQNDYYLEKGFRSFPLLKEVEDDFPLATHKEPTYQWHHILYHTKEKGTKEMKFLTMMIAILKDRIVVEASAFGGGAFPIVESTLSRLKHPNGRILTQQERRLVQRYERIMNDLKASGYIA